MKKSVARPLSIILLIMLLALCVMFFTGCTCQTGGNHYWREKTDTSWLTGDEAPHKDPTCTEEGYTDYWCNYCLEEKREILPALGHKTVVDKQGVAATCTAEGYKEISHCGVCKISLGDGSVLPKVPHVEQSTEKGVEPTCTETGIQAETRCTECGIIVKEHKILSMAPHTTVIDIAEVKPTCTKTGMTAKSHCAICGVNISQQTVIPVANTHNFGDNAKCRDCGVLNPEFIAVTSSKDLQNINLNLSGKYYLANNIDLNNVAWEAIGRGYGAFTGIFDGNGYSIGNLNCSVSNNSSKKTSTGGLFEKNSGNIRNVTITNFTLNITFNENNDNTWSDNYGTISATYGALTGVNNGKIENCVIKGTVNMTNTRTLKKYITYAKDGGNHTDNSYSYFGGIVGVNSGYIGDCCNSASFVCTTSGLVESKMGILGGINSGDSWKIVFLGDMGGIAGSNNSGGRISGCSINGSITFNSKLTANCVSNTGVAGWECQLQNAMVVGSVVGTNSGNIDDCKSKKISVNKNHSQQGVKNKTKIIFSVVNAGTNGFYGKNNGGTIGAIALI